MVDILLIHGMIRVLIVWYYHTWLIYYKDMIMNELTAQEKLLLVELLVDCQWSGNYGKNDVNKIKSLINKIERI